MCQLCEMAKNGGIKDGLGDETSQAFALLSGIHPALNSLLGTAIGVMALEGICKTNPLLEEVKRFTVDFNRRVLDRLQELEAVSS